jgi:hypothetical protein
VFIQVIQGRTNNGDALIERLKTWEKELAPGSVGWLGSTSGVTDDGRFIASARFESAEAAKKNSDRPEQDKWWSETSQYLENPVFRDCTEIDEWGQGGSDDAGFVQVIQGRVTDKDLYRKQMKEMENSDSFNRPDVIGGVTAWDGSSFTDFVYFTSEEEARKGEASMQDDPSAEQMMSLAQDLTYFDLKQPVLSSP